MKILIEAWKNMMPVIGTDETDVLECEVLLAFDYYRGSQLNLFRIEKIFIVYDKKRFYLESNRRKDGYIVRDRQPHKFVVTEKPGDFYYGTVAK